MTASSYVAFLRGINVGGRNKIPMAELRALCGELGWGEVQSYIQSGNLIFRTGGPPAVLEAHLESAIERRFGLEVPVIVRPAAAWPDYLRGNPFPEASQREPNLVMLALSKGAPHANAAEQLLARATAGEGVVQVDDALWIHFAGGAARSKISPALLDRLIGSPVTTRNWRTVFKLDELLEKAG